jgi:hypothetical protein
MGTGTRSRVIPLYETNPNSKRCNRYPFRQES